MDLSKKIEFTNFWDEPTIIPIGRGHNLLVHQRGFATPSMANVEGVKRLMITQVYVEPGAPAPDAEGTFDHAWEAFKRAYIGSVGQPAPDSMLADMFSHILPRAWEELFRAEDGEEPSDEDSVEVSFLQWRDAARDEDMEAGSDDGWLNSLVAAAEA